MANAKLDTALGPAQDILAAVDQLESLEKSLASLDALRLITSKAKMQGYRNPDNDAAATNYAQIQAIYGVESDAVKTANENAQSLYLEVEALYGHLTTSSTTWGTLLTQIRKVRAMVTRK